MPAIANYAKFIEVVRKSGLVDELRFNQLLQAYQEGGGEEEPTPLATKMVREGLISTFQAKQLLQGRWRRFVINHKYKVLDLLGQGGMGAVYLCEHTMMRRLVALKVLPEEKLQQPGALERFQREARAVATLDHPNIVHAYDMDRDDNNMHFMVMEYVDGHSFEILITKHYKGVGMDPIRAAHYISQAALGLQHAHECNWVHRDIKPANLLLDRSGVIKLLDLGLSRLYVGDEEDLTRKFDGGSVLGTADYIAPEQALNVSGVDIRADIYSLGATFYFLLAGRPPFEKGTVTQKLMYHQTKEPDPITQLRPDVPPELEEVIKTMMAKNPDDRFPNPAAVVEALAPWTQMPLPPPPEKELPNHCPLVRELLPTAGGGRSSGSWSLKSLQSSMHTPPLMRAPMNTPTGLQMSPSGRFAETVVDQAARQAVTPKSLPKVPKPGTARQPAAPTVEPASADRKVYGWIAAGAIAFVALILVVFGVIFMYALKSDTDQPLDSGRSRAAGLPARQAPPTQPARPPTPTKDDDGDAPAPTSPKNEPPKQEVPRTEQPKRSPALDDSPLITPADAKRFLNLGEVVLEMPVKSKGVANSGTRCFLNSQASHASDGNLAITFKKDLEAAVLKQAGLADLGDFVGKTIRVRGKVTEFQGKPQIIVDKAEQLSLVK